jgi:hypothetical protein
MTMADPIAAPALARALAALTQARTSLDDRARLLAAYTRAVNAMDDADRAYQSAAERIVPGARGRDLLAATNAFRAQVAGVREQVRMRVPYGDFDPLDTYVPSFPGTHADAVRAANIGDGARDEVAHLRRDVNARIAGSLSPQETEALLEAKRARNAAFEAAIREAAPAEVSDRLVLQLAELAQGWY